MAVEYLRQLEGEKHLIHLTQQGMVGLRASEDANSLASIAADARVAIHTIQADGVPLRFSRSGVLMGRSPSQVWAYSDARELADRTGGLASFYKYAAEAADRIDRATRSRYVLAYAPANSRWDGKYRRISVKVKRSDASVHFRHGYFASEQLVPYDRRQFLTYSRIASAAAWASPAKDIPVTARASATSRARGAGEVRIDISIGRSGVRFVKTDGYYSATLDLAVFVADRGRKSIGEQRETINLRLDAAQYARLQREDLGVTITVKSGGVPQHIKAVVYQYDSDRLGSAFVRIR